MTDVSGQNKQPEGDGSALSSVFPQIDEKELSQICGNAEAWAHDEINSLFGTSPDTSVTGTKCAQSIVSQNVFDTNTQADSGALNKSCTNEICLWQSVSQSEKTSPEKTPYKKMLRSANSNAKSQKGLGSNNPFEDFGKSEEMSEIQDSFSTMLQNIKEEDC